MDQLPPVDAHAVLDRVSQLAPHLVERVVAELQLQALLADQQEPQPEQGLEQPATT